MINVSFKLFDIKNETGIYESLYIRLCEKK